MRKVSLSPTRTLGCSSRMFAVATIALPSSGTSQRPSCIVGRTDFAAGGRPNEMTLWPSAALSSTTCAEAKRHGSAASTPGTASASWVRTLVRSVDPSSTCTSYEK
jgi:hypothetical protein